MRDGDGVHIWKMIVVAVAAVAVLGVPQRGHAAPQAAPLCAFLDSTTVSGTVGTASFHVVRDGCQVSLVSISKFANGSAIFDTATGVFAANETFYKLSVNMPCNIDSETDLVLGPPALYPPGDLDLGARVFNIACPSGGGGSSSGGGGGSGGGTPTPPPPPPPPPAAELPDLSTSITASKTTVQMGAPVTVDVTVTNKGKGAAGGAHVLITPSTNAILKGAAIASRGPGCSGTALIDCDLGSLGVGATATVRLRLSAASGSKLFVAAVAQRSVPDAAPADDTGHLTVKLLAHRAPFKLTATAGRIIAGEQFAFVKLSSRGVIAAQVYVGGVAQPIKWRRTFNAGTWGARIPLPKLAKGQRFTIVLRATSGASRSTATLKLKA